MSAPPPFADTLSRFVFEGAAVRGAVVSLDATSRDILACHPYPPALRRVLQELLAAAALLASTLKFKGSLVVQMQGEGAVRMLVVECDSTLALRATAQWSREAAAMPPDATLAALAGGHARARLAITLDPKDGGPMYQGIVSLEAASIAALIEHYLTSSEQIASRLVLGTAGGTARGLLLQRLPSAGPDDDAHWLRAATAVAATTEAELLAATDAAALVAARFAGEDIRLFEAKPTRFACGCSEEKIATALRLLGRAEVEGIIAEQGLVGVTCEFCSRLYAVAPEALVRA